MAPRELVSRFLSRFPRQFFRTKNALNGQISNHFFDTIGHSCQLGTRNFPPSSPSSRTLSLPSIKSSEKKSVQG